MSQAVPPFSAPRRRRRIWPWVLVAVVGLLLGTAFVAFRLAESKAGDLIRRLAAAHGVEASWSDIQLGLDGHVAIVGLAFRGTRGGRLEGEVDRIEALLTLDDLWNRRRPTDFHLQGVRLRVDREGASHLVEGGDEGDEGSGEVGPRRALHVEVSDLDLLAHLDEAHAVACHADSLQIDRSERVDLRGAVSCRAPDLGLDSGPVQVTASYDATRTAAPVDLLVEPAGRSACQIGGVRFGRAQVSGGPDGVRLQVTDMALADASALPDLPIQVEALSLGQVIVDLDHPTGDWEIARVEAGPGAVSLVRPPEQEDAPALAPAAAPPPEPAEQPDEEVLALEEASTSAEEDAGPAIDWPRLEAELDGAAGELDAVLRRATSLAREATVTDIEVSLRTGNGDPLVGAVRRLSARPGLAQVDAELAGHELSVTVEDVSQPDPAAAVAMRLTLDAQSLDLGRIALGMGRAKLLTGHLEIHLEVTTGEVLDIDLRLATHDFVFYHPAVSPRPLAFLPLSAQTHFHFASDSDERLRIDGQAMLGDALVGQLGIQVRVEDEESHLDATFHTDEVGCDDILHAIPEGMFVHMPRDEIDVEGRAGLDADVRYTFGNPRSFRLRLGDSFPGTCHITALPEGYQAEVLNEPTYVRQVPAEYLSSPDVEVQVGPGTPGYVPLDQLPPYVRAIMYFTEQRRFYDEPTAISISLLNKAVRVNLIYGRWAYGGSTITQQLVKNLFFDRDKTLARKLEEALVSWAVFDVVPADRILELYINCIEFGPDIWGIEAAAEYYFGIHATELSPIQATYLAGLKPSPLSGGTHRRRGTSPPRARWRNRLHDRLQQLADAGFIDQAYVDAQAPYIIEFPDPDAHPAPDPDVSPTPDGPLHTPFQ